MKLRIVVLAALVALLVAAPASARSVPRGWLGAQADGPLTELGQPVRLGVRPDALLGRGGRADGVRLARGAAGRERADRLRADGRGGRGRRAARAAGAAGRAPHAVVGGGAPGQGRGVDAAGDGRVHAVPDRAGRALRAVGVAVGGAAGAAADADPRLADLERAEPDALLVHPAVREGIREAAAGVAARVAGGRPGLADGARRAPQRELDRAAARSTRRAGTARSTSSRCTRTRGSRRT